MRPTMTSHILVQEHNHSQTNLTSSESQSIYTLD